MPLVNINTHTPTLDDVYIGRPSKWGNPFKLDDEGQRNDVIELYRDYILKNEELMSQIEELRGKNLVCYCTPKRCHGDVLMDILNNTNPLMSAFQ